MATSQHRSALSLGFLNIAGAGTSTFAINAAASGGFSANWLAYAFTPPESKTVNAVKVFASAVGGTLAGTDLVCDIYSDTAGTGPNASLGSTATVTATPTVAAWVEFTGLSVAVTAGTQYWVVLRNANAAPATNSVTYRYGNTNSWVTPGTGENAANSGSAVKTSTNSGGAWSSANSGYSLGWRLQFSDGTYDGVPVSAIAQLAAASSTFGKQAVGVQFVTPPAASLKVRGAHMLFGKTSTPGNAEYRLYSGSTLLATSAALVAGNVSATTRMYSAYFPSSVAVNPGTTLNLVLCDQTTADTNAKNYNQTAYTVDNDANSFALMPFKGTLRKVVTTDYTVGSPTFTADQTAVIPFSLILDSTGEFFPSGALLVG